MVSGLVMLLPTTIDACVMVGMPTLRSMCKHAKKDGVQSMIATPLKPHHILDHPVRRTERGAR
jgi:polysaccharide deacetylase 2 family uncharacterized protein YibQ